MKFNPPNLKVLMPPVTTKMLDRLIISKESTKKKRGSKYFKNDQFGRRLTSQRNLIQSINNKKSNEGTPNDGVENYSDCGINLSP